MQHQLDLLFLKSTLQELCCWPALPWLFPWNTLHTIPPVSTY